MSAVDVSAGGAGSAPRHASFDHDWEPRAYLAEYFGRVQADEREVIGYFVRAMRDVVPGEPMLFFGVGPTLSSVFLAAPLAGEIHLADYLPANLDEVSRWLRDDVDAHDWRPFVRHTLRCEGVGMPTARQVRQRERLTRERITRLLACDVRRDDPLGPAGYPSYATVVTPFCADSITDDRAAWRTYVGRIGDLVRPGGTLVVAALRRARWYTVGGRRFPSANVDVDDLRDALRPGFEVDAGSFEVRRLPEHRSQGYAGIVLASVRRRPCSVASSDGRAVA